MTYANVDRYGAFGEVYRDTGIIPATDAARRLSKLIPTRELRLLELDDGEVAAAFGLQLEISQSRSYDRTRAWGQCWYEWYEEDGIDGIRYLSRKAFRHCNVVLFLDRCGDSLDLDCKGPLHSLRSTVMRASAGYRLIPRLFDAWVARGRRSPTRRC